MNSSKNSMAKQKEKILYIAQEINPYLPETQMSTMSRMIFQGIVERGFEVRTFMPKYGCINERRNQLHEVIRLSGMNIIIDDTDHPLIIKVATLQPSRMQVYFIDNEDYFMRPPLKELELTISPDDNDERIMFFVRGVVETVRKLRWEPAIIHCSGWIAALAPLYLKRIYNDDPSFRNARIVYSLHNHDFEGTLDPRFVEKLKMDGFTDEDLKALGDGPVDFKTLSCLAIDHADAIVEASTDIDPAILDYARASGKPILSHPEPDEAADTYATFYNSMLGADE